MEFTENNSESDTDRGNTPKATPSLDAHMQDVSPAHAQARLDSVFKTWKAYRVNSHSRLPRTRGTVHRAQDFRAKIRKVVSDKPGQVGPSTGLPMTPVLTFWDYSD